VSSECLNVGVRAGLGHVRGVRLNRAADFRGGRHFGLAFILPLIRVGEGEGEGREGKGRRRAGRDKKGRGGRLTLMCS